MVLGLKSSGCGLIFLEWPLLPAPVCARFCLMVGRTANLAALNSSERPRTGITILGKREGREGGGRGDATQSQYFLMTARATKR